MQSDISNGLRFRAVDPKFWHSPAASANGVNYLTAEGNAQTDLGPAATDLFG
jgi:hypothetical protein